MMLIIGGTGTVGREVIKQLKAKQVPFRVMSRNPEKAGELKEMGAEMIQGDLANPASLEKALSGVATVFLLSAADPKVAELHSNLFHLAKRAGVTRVVRLSALGADPNSPVELAEWHGKADEALKASGIPYTILRPHYFMQNFFMFAPTIVNEGKFYAPMKQGKISLIDVRDIAAVAVASLTEEGHTGKIYDLTGQEALSFSDVARELSQATGRPIQYVEVTPEQATQSMLSAGMPAWFVSALVKLYGVFAEGYAAAVSPTVQAVTGQSPRSFAQFARDFEEAFKTDPVPAH